MVSENEAMENMGRVIKETRLKKEMTLEDLSGICGYSKALISRIENNSVAPSIESLTKIAEALNLRMYDVFASIEADEPLILRKGKRDKFSVVKGKYEMEFLTSGGSARMLQPILVSLESQVEAKNRTETHKGEEFLHVLTGKAEITVGGGSHILNTGDSIYFRAMVPHSYRGIGKGKTVFLMVMYPPHY